MTGKVVAVRGYTINKDQYLTRLRRIEEQLKSEELP